MHLPWLPRTYGVGPEILSSITDNEITALTTLAAGRDVLEIGSAYGYSAIGMAAAGASVLTIDPHTWMRSHDQMVANINAYNVSDSITVHVGYAERVLPELVGPFHLVFIDGDHSAPAVEHDLHWARKLVSSGGVIALHDYAESCCCPDVATVADRIHGPADPADVIDTLRIIRP